VDMTTGVSRVESDSGKVQGLFDQSDKGCGGAAGGPPSGQRRVPAQRSFL